MKKQVKLDNLKGFKTLTKEEKKKVVGGKKGCINGGFTYDFWTLIYG